MKKTMIILAIILIGINFTSCTQDSILEEQIEQATGGEDGEILPPEDEDDGND